MATLEEIRQKLLAQQNSNENRSSGGGDRSIYPFWNIKDDETAVLRFLEDSNQDNTYFWVERNTIRLPFQGIKGEHTRETFVTVPCIDMYGKQCPIIAETRPWWKDDDLKPLAQKYWKKRSFLFHGFVSADPLNEEPLENPIRRFVINPNLFKAIKTSLMDPDMEYNPTDHANGVDCRITKVRKGQYSDYAPTWSRKNRALTDAELEAIEKFGIPDLRTYLPKEPTETEVEVIKEMFKDSVDGLAFDGSKYGEYFRPFTPNGGSSARQNTNDHSVDEESVPFTPDEPKQQVTEKAEPVVSSDKAAEASKIMEILRARKNT